MTSTLEATELQADFDAPAGDQLFSSRFLPWMKVGAVIDDASVDAATAARLGGIDFDVEMRRLTYAVGKSTKTVPNRKAIVRVDTDDYFTTVSTGYKIVQYRDAFEFMDTISPRYVAAGSMSNGKQGFMVVQLTDFAAMDIEVNGAHDPHDLYVVLRTSHDLSKAIEVSLMPLRRLCMNQLGLRSFSTHAWQRRSIKHVGDPLKKLAQAQDVLSNTEKYTKVFAEKAHKLGDVSVTPDEFNTVLERVLPDRPRRADQIAAIQKAFAESPVVGFTGTGWGAMNAVSEYFQWQRNEGTRTDQSMFTSGLNGDAYKYTNRTAQLLLAR